MSTIPPCINPLRSTPVHRVISSYSNPIADFVGSDEPIWRGFFYTGLICTVSFVNTLLAGQYFYRQYLVGMRVRTALTSAIYKKSVKLSNMGRKEMTSN